MKAASVATKALLASGVFELADLYTFTLIDSTVIRWTSCDYDITLGGNFYSSKGPALKRGGVKSERGLSVDQLDITVAATLDINLGGLPLIWALEAGAFDGAMCLVETAVMGTWGQTDAGTVIRFLGRVADISGNRGECVLTVKSLTELLDTMMPRNLYQPGCGNTLYDATCGVVQATYSFATSALSGSTTTLIKTALAQADGYFTLGRVKCDTGANAGAFRTIKKHVTSDLFLAYPFNSTPGIGDTFTVSAGCPKTKAICESRFSNLLKFRGQPYIPVAETAF